MPITIEDIESRPDPIVRMPSTEDLDLFTIYLPPGEVSPPDIDWEGWTGNQWKIKAGDHDGVRLIGHPQGTTLIPTTRDATMTIGPAAGVVVLEDVKILPGSRYAILFENKTNERYCLLRMRKVELLRKPPTDGRARSSKWSFLHYGVDRDYQNCIFDGHYNSEHIDYGHGCSRFGARFVDCDFVSSGGEQLKNTWRPQEVPFYVPGCEFYVMHCRFQDWHQDHSDVGGAAITLQGAGYLYMRVMRSVFIAKQIPGRCKAVMVDDGLSTVRDEADNRTRAFSVTTCKPLGQAVDDGDEIAVNGFLLMHLCASSGIGSESLTDVVRCGTTYKQYAEAWGHRTALGVSIRRCGLYGKNTKIALDTHWTDIRRNNTPIVAALVNHVCPDIDTTHEPVVISHGNEKLSDLN